MQGRLPDRPLSRTLLFGDLTQLGVVEQHVGDVHAVLDRGVEVAHVLAESSVAAYRDDLAVPVFTLIPRGGPGAHGGREGKADRSEITRHQDTLPLAFEITAE